MCLIAFAYKTHPQYELLLVANRDEYYQRESTEMHWWPSDLVSGDHSLLAGRDERAGGTWFGVTRSGDWAALTNFREPVADRQNAKTRGELVTSFLLGKHSPTQFVEKLKRVVRDYNGFNLLMSNHQGVFCLTHRIDESDVQVESVKPGLYGLSNHILNSDWPKVRLAKARLMAEIEREKVQANKLVWTLFDSTHPDDKQLPDTGVGLETERLLSPMFIANEELQYGTRSTAAMTITHSGKIEVAEKSHPGGSLVEFQFKRER